MASPFYIVYTESQRDITKYVTSFDYTRSVEKDNLLSLPMKGMPKSLFDDSELQRGKQLIIRYGYLGGKLSKPTHLVIDQIRYGYRAENSMTIKARDAGSKLKKTNVFNFKGDKNLKAFLDEVAKFEFIAFKDTEGILSNIYLEYVHNQDVYSTIKKAIERHNANKGAAYVLSIQGNEIKALKRDFGPQPLRTFYFGSDDFKEFTIETKNNDDSAGVKVVSSNIDDETGEVIESSSEDQSGDTSTGKHKHVYNAMGEKIDEVIEKPVDAAERVVVSGSDKKKSDSEVAAKNKEAVTKEIKGNFQTPGDPYLVEGELISLANLSELHNGNWRMAEVRDKIDGSGYITYITLDRNGSKLESGSGETNEKVNNQTGGNDTDGSKEIPVHTYNENGVEV